MINNITEVMKDFFGTEIKVNDIVAFTNPVSSRKSFVEIETENPYFDGDIYPNKYDYVKKRPENVIVKTV